MIKQNDAVEVEEQQKIILSNVRKVLLKNLKYVLFDVDTKLILVYSQKYVLSKSTLHVGDNTLKEMAVFKIFVNEVCNKIFQ